MVREALKSPEFLVLVIFLIASVFAISPNPFAHGVYVKWVEKDSPLYGVLKPGDVITYVNEKRIEGPDDFRQFYGAGTVRAVVNGDLTIIDLPENPGLRVGEVPKSRVKLGMDLVGGTRVLLKVVGNVSDQVVEETIDTLQARINIYGLREAKFRKAESDGEKYILIEMAGGTRKEIEDLLARQGEFEARIPKNAVFTDGKWILRVFGKNYTLESVNESFEINGVEFVPVNVSGKKAVVEAVAFRSEDIISVCMFDQPGVCRSYVMKSGTKGYEFLFQIFITEKSAERFKDLISDLPVVFDPAAGDFVLKGGVLNLYMDEKRITQLSISPDLKGKIVTQPVVTGFNPTEEGAKKEMKLLQSVLKSGRLPVELELSDIEEISPSLGAEFLNSVFAAAFVGMIAVSLIVFFRYRDPRIVIPMIFTSFSEVLLVLGAAALIGWTIDLPAIAGIIIVIGTGIDAQIMIIDELLSGKRVYTLKERIKRAFFIIFSSAGVTSAAMLPLIYLGAGTPLAGFAITTLIGLGMSVLITRPAFGKICEVLIASKPKS